MRLGEPHARLELPLVGPERGQAGPGNDPQPDLRPQDWPLRQRAERAAARLRSNPELSIARVAHDCGFSISQYFATVFRRYPGMSPGACRGSGSDKSRLNDSEPAPKKDPETLLPYYLIGK